MSASRCLRTGSNTITCAKKTFGLRSNPPRTCLTTPLSSKSSNYYYQDSGCCWMSEINYHQLTYCLFLHLHYSLPKGGHCWISWLHWLLAPNAQDHLGTLNPLLMTCCQKPGSYKQRCQRVLAICDAALDECHRAVPHPPPPGT
jgi:hypothetical protein